MMLKNLLFSKKIISILLLLFSLVISLSLGSYSFLVSDKEAKIPSTKEGYTDEYYQELLIKKSKDAREKYLTAVSNS
jgi:hypothetical protein